MTTPQSLDESEVAGAVDALILAYNASRAAYLGHPYVSATLVADDHLRDAVRAVLTPVYEELDRLEDELRDSRDYRQKLITEAVSVQ